VGEAIARAVRPPRVWLQASAATIYAHRFDAANDEHSGILSGNEPDAATKWMLEIGAIFLRTETQLILKSRRVVPTRLLDRGFRFKYADWCDAARELCGAIDSI
jgi:NAD dependent epimerase/dehydratase family enzyme